MIKTFKEKLKTKWYHHIPVIGNMIFGVKINLFRSVQEKSFKKTVNLYKVIFDIFFLILILGFMISFWIFRNKCGFGKYPWMLWVAISISIFINISPLWTILLFKMGIKRYERKISSGDIIEAKPTTIKKRFAEIDEENAKKKQEKRDKKENIQ